MASEEEDMARFPEAAEMRPVRGLNRLNSILKVLEGGRDHHRGKEGEKHYRHYLEIDPDLPRV